MVSDTKYRVIGKRIPKVGADGMVRGQATYAADVQLPATLHGMILRSCHAHARIKSIDISEALQLPGVKAIVTGEEFRDIASDITFPLGEIPIGLKDIAELVIAKGKVLFHGHAVAAVAAVDPFIAEQALGLIHVEYEELTPVLDLLDAMKPGAPLVHDDLFTHSPMGEKISSEPSNIAMTMELERGDVDKGLAEADVVVEREFRVGMAHQGYIEPPAATARWDADDHLTVWTTTQGSFTIQMQLAGIFQMPVNKVRVIPTEVGGAFGGKIYVMLEPLAAALARKASAPVKMVMSREEVLRATGPGSPAAFRVKAGCTNDGKITAFQMWMAYDAGCMPGSPMFLGVISGLGAYKLDNFRIEGHDVVTNKTRVHMYRAPGAPHVVFAVEQAVDMMAQAINVDPLAFRKINSVEEGDLDPMGAPWPRIGLKEILQRIEEHPHWKSKLEAPNCGRGLALGAWSGAQFTSSATVSINADGTATLVVGSVDLTGTRTALLQLCAEELGLDEHQVSVVVGDTETAPYCDVTGGQRTTYSQSAAIHRACQDALTQLLQRAATRLETDAEQIQYGEGRFWPRANPGKSVTLQELARAGDGAVIGRGSASGLRPAPVFAAHLADVEVEPDTGKVNILRYTCFQDVGLAVNPTRIEAQMQGGAAQGIGWALTEEYVFDDRGAVRNASLLDYRQPTALDLPFIDCDIIEVPASDGPHGIRGVGEGPIIPPLGAVANAIARATGGVRVCQAPMTPERVYWAIREGRK